MKSLIQGFKYNIRGLQYFFSHATLWKYAVIPLLLTTVTFGSFIYFGLMFYDDIYYFVAKPFGTIDVQNPSGVWDYTLDFVFFLLRNIMRVMAVLISAFLVIVGGYLVSSIVNAPFFEMLSEKVLILENARQDMPFQFARFWGELKAGVKVEVVKAGFFVVVTLALLLLCWIPLIGFVFGIVQFLFSAWFYAFGLSIYPFVMNRTDVQKVFSWGFSRKRLLIGFGLPSLIPFVGLFMMCFQVVGGALLYLENQPDAPKQ